MMGPCGKRFLSHFLTQSQLPRGHYLLLVWIGKLRPREVERFAEGHTAAEPGTHMSPSSQSPVLNRLVGGLSSFPDIYPLT